MKLIHAALTLIAAACSVTAALAQCLISHVDDGNGLELMFPLTESGWTGDPQTTGPWGFDLSGRNLTVKPGDDFFKWANGAWEARTQIPADRSRYGNFDALRSLSDERVRDIANSPALDRSTDSDAAKISAAWRSFMDQAAVEELDATPIAPALGEVRRARTLADMTRLMGRANFGIYRSLFDVSIRDDAKDPERYAVYIDTGGLGMPDRDYYLDHRFADKKLAYERYVAQMLRLVGWPDDAAAARDVVALETRIAKATWTRADRRDRDKTYNPMTLTELQAYAPGLQWAEFLAYARLATPERVVLVTNTAFPRIAALFKDTPLGTLQAWQAFHVVDSAAPLLSRRFVQPHFMFRAATQAGQTEEKPRWKRAVEFVNGALGESVGRLYVERYFPAQSKEMMATLVGNIRDAMQQRIERLDWMSAATKQQALTKLSKVGVKIGYPDGWRDYAGLDIRGDDLYGNSIRAAAFEWERVASRLGQQVDKTEWGMTPQTVNAYYSPVKNEIVFPAAILQPPFFDPFADPAINYGGIGGVIGHEITHGFDDQGRKSDGDGVLRDWWSALDASKFKFQAQRLGQQYSTFEPLPGAMVNGMLTMGENIGDLGGLSVALDAYRISLKGKPAELVDGITGDQRVFLGWAQVWRSKSRDDAMRQQLVSDSHSPPSCRVNGIVRNLDAWYQAFNVKPGDKLFVPAPERVRIW